MEKNEILEKLENLKESNKINVIVGLWNQLANDYYYTVVFENSREDINMLLFDCNAWDVINRLSDYKKRDPFCFMTDAGFVQSFETLDDLNCPIDLEDLAGYIHEYYWNFEEYLNTL